MKVILIIFFLQSKHEHYHVFCFNLSADVIQNFEALPKAANGSGSYAVKYRHASFDHSKECCEIYLQFIEQANNNRLVQFFEDAGACQVMTVPLDRESKKAAFESVLKLGAKTGCSFFQGEIHKDLKKLLSMPQMQSNAEFDEKTAAFIKSMDAKVEQMQGGVSAVDAKVELMQGGVIAVDEKVDQVQAGMSIVKEEVTGVKESVSWVVEQQKRMTLMEDENKRLIAENKRINKLRDQLEQKVGKETEYKNKYEAALAENAELKKQLEDKNKTISMWESSNTMYSALECAKWIITNSTQAMESVSGTLEAAERASKRAKAD